jgi:hypothetical protein
MKLTIDLRASLDAQIESTTDDIATLEFFLTSDSKVPSDSKTSAVLRGSG